MIYCGSKNDFCKKSGGLLFSAKVQNHPGSSEIGSNLHKIQKNTSEGCRNKTRADMHILGGLLFMWGVFPSFRFHVSVAASQKKPDFGTLKMEKPLFIVQNKNQPPWGSSLSQGARAWPIWPRSDKVCHAHRRI
jgi:hypothetical protein